MGGDGLDRSGPAVPGSPSARRLRALPCRRPARCATRTGDGYCGPVGSARPQEHLRVQRGAGAHDPVHTQLQEHLRPVDSRPGYPCPVLVGGPVHLATPRVARDGHRARAAQRRSRPASTRRAPGRRGPAPVQWHTTPTRSPVNGPGPTPTATASTSRACCPASAKHTRQQGPSSSPCRRPATTLRCASTHSLCPACPSACSTTAATHAADEVSRARTSALGGVRLIPTRKGAQSPAPTRQTRSYPSRRSLEPEAGQVSGSPEPAGRQTLIPACVPIAARPERGPPTGPRQPGLPRPGQRPSAS